MTIGGDHDSIDAFVCEQVAVIVIGFGLIARFGPAFFESFGMNVADCDGLGIVSLSETVHQIAPSAAGTDKTNAEFLVGTS
jgi:hypothetical protein